MPSSNRLSGNKIQEASTRSVDRELRESIRYAGLIQKALLPQNKSFSRLLPSHFILFMPRESLSGDFYWVKRINGCIYLAAADCTGHGIPGALMSFLGITFLNEVVRNGNSHRANRILNALREKVMDALQQTGKENEARDGMDFSLCIIDPSTRKMQFAGANNPVYLVRDRELVELKADKMPIGVNAADEKPFKNREILLEPDDRLYLFTDGYTDQFGGPRNKKFKFRAFRKILLDIHRESMAKQRRILEKTIFEWMGDEEQLDDILIIGVNLKPVLK